MEKTITSYLAAKHILVADGPSEHAVEALFAIGYRFNVHITEGREMASAEHIRTIAETVGQFVPEPFYRGFPETVRRMGQVGLYLDRIAHYASAAGLLPGEVVHHSIFEEEMERSTFVEKTEANAFVIISTEKAKARLFAYLDDAVSSTRPLSDEVFAVLAEAIKTEGYRVTALPCKNTRIRLLAATRELGYLDGLSLTDILKVTEYLQADRTPEEVDMKKLSLPARDRRFIATLLDILLEGKSDFTECYEKKKIFCGLLHHIHYKAKCENGAAFLRAMRGRENLSTYSRLERAIAVGDVCGATDLLLREKGGTAVLRHLNFLLSRASGAEDVAYVMAALPEDNPIVYLQLLQEYASRGDAPAARSFIFPRRGLVRTHTETPEEVEARRSFLPTEIAKSVEAYLRARLAAMLKGRLGRVYIDPAMYRIAVPLSEGSSQGGLGVLPKGSRLPLAEGYKVRAFTYWEQVDDIDLSVQGVNFRDGTTREFSWRTFLAEEAGSIVFSGDQTDGFHGGSEFFDVDLAAFRAEHPDLTHLIFCNAVYSQKPFSQLVCRAGYMLREREDSGEVFEPKTVKSSFAINCESTEAYLFGIDLETSELVWLNLARDSHRRISGTSSFAFLERYLKAVSVLSLGALFELLATEVVERPEDADTILSDDAALAARCIRSYDTEAVLALLA